MTRSVSVTTAVRLRAPMIKSPSEWPGSLRSAAAGGRSEMGRMSPSGLRFACSQRLRGFRRLRRRGSHRQEPTVKPRAPHGS